LIGVASTNFAYFYFYTLVRTTYINRFATMAGGKPQIGTLMELFLGTLAGALGQIFTIPVSVVATRQQTASEDDKDKGLLQVAKDVVDEDGISGLWKGLKASLVLTINPAITYGLFERLKPAFLQSGSATATRSFLLGALCKTIATVVTYPYIMGKVRIQASRGNDQGGILDVIMAVIKRDGPGGLYKGMQAQIVKAVLCQALLFVMKDVFERRTIVAFALLSRLFNGREIAGVKA